MFALAFVVFLIHFGLSKIMKHNGFEYVDLGLPSGTKWATCNVGAKSETDYGLYFAWGGNKGCSSPNGAKLFDRRNYKFSNSTSSSTFTKYNSTDGKTVLDLEDDAAYVYMGGRWHMPSSEQIKELITNTESAWIIDYHGSGVNGRLFTSNINGEKLFFPACAMLFVDHCYGLNNSGSFWSNSIGSYYSDFGKYLWFNQSGIGIANGNRVCGLGIRGVFNTFWTK